MPARQLADWWAGLQPRLREVQVEVRPETSQPLDLAGELLRLQGYSIEVLQLAGGRQNHIGFPRPSRWNFLGLFLARADRLQARPHLIGVRPGQVLSTDPDAEDHHLFEGRIRGCVDAQAGEVVAQPTGQLIVQDVVRNNQDHDAAVLQQRQAALVERFLQTPAAAALVLRRTGVVRHQVAIRRVEPEQSERLPADHGVEKVTVQHSLKQASSMVGALAVVLDSEGLDLVAAEDVCCLSQGNPLTGAGITDPHPARRGGSEGLQSAFEGDLIGREVAVACKVARQAREHEGHGASLSLRGMAQACA